MFTSILSEPSARDLGVIAPRSLAGATRGELAAALIEIGAPEREMRMRSAQLWRWIYHQGVCSFDEMLNVSKDFRARLAERFTLARPQIVSEQVSRDGTLKWLIRLEPVHGKDRGAEVECVYIPESDRG